MRLHQMHYRTHVSQLLETYEIQMAAAILCVISLDLFPDTCHPRTQANSCHVIDGGITITVQSDEEVFDGEELSGILPTLFDTLVFDDPLVVIEYIGDITSLDEMISGHNNAKAGNETSSESSLPVTMIIASVMVLAGGLGTILMLVLLGKTDDGVDDDDSSDHDTSDTTTVMSSPVRTRQMDGDDLIRRWPNPFIIAEEEEATWMGLGINPASHPVHLECILEEVSSDSEDYFDERSI